MIAGTSPDPSAVPQLPHLRCFPVSSAPSGRQTRRHRPRLRPDSARRGRPASCGIQHPGRPRQADRLIPGTRRPFFRFLAWRIGSS
ncbi:unnamed protein product [Phaeothamnion confervicola]